MAARAVTGVLDNLRSTGFAVVGTLAPREVAEVNEFLLSRPVYVDAHVAETARKCGDKLIERAKADETECLCVHEHDAVITPHLLERAMRLTDLVAAHLDRDPPLLYSANAFWTRPGVAPLRDDIQAFHTDSDDERFVVLFTYLTDVYHASHGPHCMRGPDGVERVVSGSAGTMFLAETRYPHLGLKPLHRERGVHWFRWGVSDLPASYGWDGLSPVQSTALGDRYPADPRLRASLRLLVTPP